MRKRQREKQKCGGKGGDPAVGEVKDRKTNTRKIARGKTGYKEEKQKMKDKEPRRRDASADHSKRK